MDGDRLTSWLAAAYVAAALAAAVATAPEALLIPIGFVAWGLLLFLPLVALSRIAAAIILLCAWLRSRRHRPRP